ncbi:MAG TPA: RNA polymerase factor sigma-54 [Anseongella sp.]
MLRQKLQQKLLQKLSPQQIQFIKLLQVPTVMLDARIKEELEDNPALEDPSLLSAESEEEYEELDEKHNEETAQEERTEDDFNIDDYLQDDDRSDYAEMMSYGGDDDEDRKEIPIAVGVSFYDDLEKQLNLVKLDGRQYVMAIQIIGSIDDDGYLRRPISSLVDDLAFSQNVIVDDEDMEEVLYIVQQFDPPGIAARNLQECLLIQLQKKRSSNPAILTAIEIVENHLDEFTRKHYDKLEKALGIDSNTLKEAVGEILKLNPKPGDSAMGNSDKQMQVIPDFRIANNDGELVLTLNGKNAPDLRVSRSYLEMFDTYDKQAKKDKKLKEAVQFVKQKLDAAKWFIDAIKQRQQTLIKTMDAIMEYQYEYFLDGDERKLKPMILKDIADRINMDISTVSRVANSKYVQTDFGTFLLKSFFSEAIQTESGEEVSNREVKKILEECIAREDKHKPLADEKLTDILKEKGYNIARRTVAKYREQLNIPVARLRKEL